MGWAFDMTWCLGCRSCTWQWCEQLHKRGSSGRDELHHSLRGAPVGARGVGAGTGAFGFGLGAGDRGTGVGLGDGTPLLGTAVGLGATTGITVGFPVGGGDCGAE